MTVAPTLWIPAPSFPVQDLVGSLINVEGARMRVRRVSYVPGERMVGLLVEPINRNEESPEPNKTRPDILEREPLPSPSQPFETA